MQHPLVFLQAAACRRLIQWLVQLLLLLPLLLLLLSVPRMAILHAPLLSLLPLSLLQASLLRRLRPLVYAFQPAARRRVLQMLQQKSSSAVGGAPLRGSSRCCLRCSSARPQKFQELKVGDMSGDASPCLCRRSKGVYTRWGAAIHGINVGTDCTGR